MRTFVLRSVVLSALLGIGMLAPGVDITRAQGGDFGDSVLLAPKVGETSGGGRVRLPLLLRNNLEAAGVRVFNPRGRDLGDIPTVQQLLGVVLECIDPNAAQQDAIQSMSPGILAWPSASSIS